MEDGLIYRIVEDREENEIILKEYKALPDDWNSYAKKLVKDGEKEATRRILLFNHFNSK